MVLSSSLVVANMMVIKGLHDRYFMAREINRGARKLTRTPTLKKEEDVFNC
jgi:hypothetical protein